jgi:hypothetical protein
MEPVIAPVVKVEQTARWWASRSTTTKVILGLLGIGIVIGGIATYNHFTRKEDAFVPDNGDIKEPEPKTEGAIDLFTLPNKGIGCSPVRDTFDTSFSYVKCNGVWYVISKESPANESTGAKFKDWTVVESEVTIKLLNSRYPN